MIFNVAASSIRYLQFLLVSLNVAGEPAVRGSQEVRAPVGEPGRDSRRCEHTVGRGHVVHVGVPRGRVGKVCSAHVQQQIPEPRGQASRHV